MGSFSDEGTAPQDYVLYRGFKLPPKRLRWGGPRYHDDDTYLRSGESNARMLSQLCGLSRDSKILDIGCGAGRLLTGILSHYGSIGEYVGIDVHRPSVEWASRYLANLSNHISFLWVDFLNERYNPNGSPLEDGRLLPVPTGRFDLVTLFSVFSHMRLSDVEKYLKEIRRTLAPNGKVFLSVFVEYGGMAEEENPKNYYREWSGPLHCIKFNRHKFEDVIYRYDLQVDYFRYRHTNDGQSTYVLSRLDQQPFQAAVIRS